MSTHSLRVACCRRISYGPPVERVYRVRTKPRNIGVGAFACGHFDLHQQLRTRQAGKTASQEGGTTVGEPRWPLAALSVT